MRRIVLSAIIACLVSSTASASFVWGGKVLVCTTDPNGQRVCVPDPTCTGKGCRDRVRPMGAWSVFIP